MSVFPSSQCPLCLLETKENVMWENRDWIILPSKSNGNPMAVWKQHDEPSFEDVGFICWKMVVMFPLCSLNFARGTIFNHFHIQAVDLGGHLFDEKKHGSWLEYWNDSLSEQIIQKLSESGKL
jgi:hypothetical protein